MKPNNRIMTALLTASLLLAASCGGEASGNEIVTASVSSDIPTETTQNALPDTDLGGFELHMAKQTQDKIAWASVAFTVEEENGEVLNDAIFRRNQRVCEKYNFSMSDTEFPDPLSVMTKQNMAGDTEHDIFLISLNKINTVSNSENLINIHDVPTVDLEGGWWDQDMLRDLDINGKQFFINGDLIFSVYDCLRVIMYNKGYAEDLRLDGFYELVNEGRWTVDRMYEMMQLASADLNSDGAMDYRDVFGLMYNTNSYSAYITAQDLKLINSDGTIGVFNDRFTKIYDNLLKLFDRKLGFNYNSDKYPGLTAREAIVTLFDNKQALFFENGMSAAAQYMRDVQNVDFGFLPLPKLDEAQDKYYSYVSVSAPVLCIPVTSIDRIDPVGFALEALCRDSSEKVVPEYFNTCFSAKYTHDAESYDMILLATASRMYDIGIIFDFGKLQSTISTAVSNRDEAIMSKLEAIRETVSEQFKINYLQ